MRSLHNVRFPVPQHPSGYEHKLARVLMGGFVADLEEQWDLLNLKHANSKHPDIKYLVNSTQLTDLNGTFPMRTEQLTLKVNPPPPNPTSH